MLHMNLSQLQSSTFFHISSSAGRCAARGRSAVRCMGWRTVTCGALPAAGKRPARDSLTERTSPTQLHGSPTGTAAFCQRIGGSGINVHAFGFLQLKIATVRQAPALLLLSVLSAPLNHFSGGSNSWTAESPFTFPARIPSTASPFPSFPV